MKAKKSLSVSAHLTAPVVLASLVMSATAMEVKTRVNNDESLAARIEKVHLHIAIQSEDSQHADHPGVVQFPNFPNFFNNFPNYFNNFPNFPNFFRNW